MKFKTLVSMFVEKVILKFIRLKYFYPYVFVHKPLCRKYKNDSINFKNIYVCRSCFFLYLGILFALILYGNIDFNLYILLLSFLIFFLSNPMFYRFYSRKTRDFSRFFLGFLTILLLLNMYSYDKYLFVFLLICLLIIKHLYNIQRKQVDLCSNCSELAKNRICTGYALQTTAMLQIEEEMSKFIMYKRWRLKYD